MGRYQNVGGALVTWSTVRSVQRGTAVVQTMTPRWRSSPHFRITQTKLTPGTLSLNSTTLARLSKRERQKQRRQLRAIVRAEATRGLAEEPARLASLQGPAEEPEPLLEGLEDDSGPPSSASFRVPRSNHNRTAKMEDTVKPHIKELTNKNAKLTTR